MRFVAMSEDFLALRCGLFASPARRTSSGKGGSMGAAGFRLRAACGLAGPALFTAAWLASTFRQVGYSIAEEHLSGLAAPDARDPAIMISGFVGLGACTVAFGSALREALGARGRAGPGPALVGVAGVATIAAGLLRRDRMLLHPLDGGGQSWHNDGHDLAGGARLRGGHRRAARPVLVPRDRAVERHRPAVRRHRPARGDGRAGRATAQPRER